jgi:post-segregation antitoxin (ccd killing protein)
VRITVRVPDELGEEVKRRTDNVSAYVVDALTEKLERERRRAARRGILERAQKGEALDEDLHAINPRERRDARTVAPR